MSGMWVKPEKQTEVVQFVAYWHQRSGVTINQMLRWLAVAPGKYYRWQKEAGQAGMSGPTPPKSHWLLPAERRAIVAYAQQHPQWGYRYLSYQMLDEDVAAVSPSSVYRVLKAANLVAHKAKTSSKKGKGFTQPTRAHQHWHIDISYLNICGTFYYLCSILDGYSRYLVHWEIREQMTEVDVEIIVQRALEKFPKVTPRLISDNGPQFIARDFKAFVREQGLTHVRISPGYPQSNGKKERWFQTLKGECIRLKTPLSVQDARRVVSHFVSDYNEVRLHSAIGYVTPLARLTGQDARILADRQKKLQQARDKRRAVQQQQKCLA